MNYEPIPTTKTLIPIKPRLQLVSPSDFSTTSTISGILIWFYISKLIRTSGDTESRDNGDLWKPEDVTFDDNELLTTSARCGLCLARHYELQGCSKIATGMVSGM